MGVRRTPPLSREGAREVAREVNRPPEDTPERRRTFRIAREVKRLLAEAED